MHIKEVTNGDFVRIKLNARHPMIYKQVAPGGYELVAGQPKKRDRTWDTALLTGGVIVNEPENGLIRIGVQNQQTADQVFRATVPYVSIAMMHVGTVEIIRPTVPEFLKGTSLPPRIKYIRVSF